MKINEDRNEIIAALVKEKRLSYSVIAEMLGVTRCAVAGVAFRIKHPPKVLYRSGKHNCTGTGWRRSSYYPEKTAVNSR